MNSGAIAIQERGHSHETSGLPCQDYCNAGVTSSKAWLALADGAGFSPLAQHGAIATVQSMKGLLWKFRRAGKCGLCETEKSTFLAGILEQLDRIAKKKACDLELLASTLLAVQTWEGHYLALHLGDGAIGCYHADGSVTELSGPENGRYANQTWFTTSSDACEHLRVYHGELGDIQGFCAFSDGAADSLYDDREHLFAPVVPEIFKMMQTDGVDATRANLGELMQGAIRNQTNDDVSFACFLLPTLLPTIQSGVVQRNLPKKWSVPLDLDDSEESVRRYEAMLKVVRFVMGQPSLSCTIKKMERHAHWEGQNFYRAIITPLTKAQILIHEGGQLYRAGEHAKAFVKEEQDNV